MKKTRIFWVIFLGMLALSVSIEPNSRLGFAASSAIGPQASSPIFSCFGNKNQPPAPPADTTPPETTITSYPSNPTNQVTATFEFTCNEGSCTYDCQIDSGGWISCASPIIYSGLFEGDHTFEVKAWDGSGNVDLTPAIYSWAILTPWAKSYGGTVAEFPSFIQPTSDGGYIVAASTNSFGAGSYDSWVLKLNSDGTVAWQKTYSGTSDDYAYSIQQTTDGGYIAAGLTQSFGAGYYDFWVLKLNSDGTVNWQKAYGGTGSESAYSIQQTSDGGYIVAG
ncbi:MAG: hypothetical protein PHE84_09915 [bacterium]|nr:hypothetical protein [bacterium]